MINKVILLLSMFLFAACTNRYQLLQTKQPSVQIPKAKQIDYKILPHDRIKVILYEDARMVVSDSSRTLGTDLNPGGFLVDSRGKVTLPLIGTVKVAGLTQSQAAEKLRRLYGKEMTKPYVYVEIMNKRIYLIGEVQKPGAVKLDKEKINLLEAIAFAGGLKDTAVRDSIVILSPTHDHRLQMREIDLTDFDTLRYDSLVLKANDIVYVKPNRLKAFKVMSEEYTAPFVLLTRLLSPFVTWRALTN